MNHLLRKKRRVVTNNNIMLIILFAMIFLFLIFIQSQIANAKEKDSYKKSFVTIEISTGDTLSSIAATYGKPGQDSHEYIEEVISMNQLTDDTIHSGCYLIVPVYQKVR